LEKVYPLKFNKQTKGVSHLLDNSIVSYQL